jgi:hypothetical protein
VASSPQQRHTARRELVLSLLATKTTKTTSTKTTKTTATTATTTAAAMTSTFEPSTSPPLLLQLAPLLNGVLSLSLRATAATATLTAEQRNAYTAHVVAALVCCLAADDAAAADDDDDDDDEDGDGSGSGRGSCGSGGGGGGGGGVVVTADAGMCLSAAAWHVAYLLSLRAAPLLLIISVRPFTRLERGASRVAFIR